MVDIIDPKTSTVRPVAFHAIFDCSGCDIDKMKNEANIKNWLADLTPKIGLTATGTATVTAGETSGLVGYVAVQLAGSNSIDANFVDANREIYIDIFANDQFNPEVVEASIKEFFGNGVNIRKILIPRNASAAV